MALNLEQTKEYIAQQFLHVPEIIHRFNKIAVILKQDKEAPLPPHLLNFILHGGSSADPTPQTSGSNNTTPPQTPPQNKKMWSLHSSHRKRPHPRRTHILFLATSHEASSKYSPTPELGGMCKKIRC